jgi:hypothetical protein
VLGDFGLVDLLLIILFFQIVAEDILCRIKQGVIIERDINVVDKTSEYHRLWAQLVTLSSAGVQVLLIFNNNDNNENNDNDNNNNDNNSNDNNNNDNNNKNI